MTSGISSFNNDWVRPAVLNKQLIDPSTPRKKRAFVGGFEIDGEDDIFIMQPTEEPSRDFNTASSYGIRYPAPVQMSMQNIYATRGYA